MNLFSRVNHFLILAITLSACSMAGIQKGAVSNQSGLDMENTVSMEITLTADRYPGGQQQESVVLQMLRRISALPQVASAGAIDLIPFSVHPQSRGLTIESASGRWSGDGARYNIITPDYFRVVRIPLLKGRQFTESDTGQSQSVAIISAETARLLFPERDPVGEKLLVTRVTDVVSRGPWMTVVGVVGDVKDADGKSIIDIYAPYTQNPTAVFSLLLRANTEPTNLIPIVRDEILALDQSIRITNARAFSK